MSGVGYEEGRNIVIDYRWAEGDYERFRTLRRSEPEEVNTAELARRFGLQHPQASLAGGAKAEE
jgi:hypothetical protein